MKSSAWCEPSGPRRPPRLVAKPGAPADGGREQARRHPLARAGTNYSGAAEAPPPPDPASFGGNPRGSRRISPWSASRSAKASPRGSSGWRPNARPAWWCCGLIPKKIRASEFAYSPRSRAQGYDDAEFRLLKEDIRMRASSTRFACALPRRTAGYEFEIIYGHRRHAACLALDRGDRRAAFEVLTFLDVASVDRKRLALQMHAENDVREDLSPYEYGRMYSPGLTLSSSRLRANSAAAVGRDDTPVSLVPADRRPSRGSSCRLRRSPRRSRLRWTPQLMRPSSSIASHMLADRPHESADIKSAAGVSPGDAPAADRGPWREAVIRPHVKRPSRSRVGSRFESCVAMGRLTLKFGSEIGRPIQKELVEEIKELTEKRLTQYLKAKPQ